MAEESLLTARVHGGPDGDGVPLHDFSSNGNACGPCPQALQAVNQADASRYPDAGYTALRNRLAAFHGVDARRVVLAASASEFIFRMTALVAKRGGHEVCLPPMAYGDYAQAAQAWGLTRVTESPTAALCWACEPSSPTGAAHEGLERLVESASASTTLVLDLAYEPLRLSGALSLGARQLDKVWQLWTPNKALGLTGVRAAYAVAPLHSNDDVRTMEALCPSWPIGAHGVAMLDAWTQPAVQAWLAGSLGTLRDWKTRQVAMCASLGWKVLPSQANFFVCHTGLDPVSMTARGDGLRIGSAMTSLQESGIKLRDCSSFGLPGYVRLSVQAPDAQEALKIAWLAWTRETVLNRSATTKG